MENSRIQAGQFAHIAEERVEFGQFEEALEAYRAEIKIRRTISSKDGEILKALNNAALIASKTGRKDEAGQYSEEAVQIAEELYEEDHPERRMTEKIRSIVSK